LTEKRKPGQWPGLQFLPELFQTFISAFYFSY